MSDRHHSGATTPQGRRDDVVAAQKRRFGGMKFGSAFFGWLTATGMLVLLTALLSAVGAGVGLATSTDPGQVAEQATQDAATVGIVSAIVLIVILLLSYFCGGYVAGRMARFDGARQGIAVWLWAILIAVVLAAIGAVAGSQFNLFAQFDGVPSIPMQEGALTAGGVIALVIAVLVPLIGAVLGGIAGMRYHRRIDQAGTDYQTSLRG